jgi:hypothetical protein
LDCDAELPPQAVKPTAKAKPATPRMSGQTIFLNRRDDLRSIPANGIRIRPSAIGSAPLLNGLGRGIASAVVGTLTVIVTFVALASAAKLEGEKVAVAPVGSPVTENVIGPASVFPVGGVTAKV